MESLGKDVFTCLSEFLSVADVARLRACSSYLKKAVVNKIRGYDFSNIEEVLSFACEDGHMDIAKYAIRKGVKNFDAGLVSACKGGRMEPAILMIQKLANSYIMKRNAVNKGFVSACWYGHALIAHYMIVYGATRRAVCDGFKMACYNGHLEVVIMLVSHRCGYRGYDAGLKIARENNHENLVYLLLGLRAKDKRK
jgi:hypothetical protein